MKKFPTIVTNKSPWQKPYKILTANEVPCHPAARSVVALMIALGFRFKSWENGTYNVVLWRNGENIYEELLYVRPTQRITGVLLKKQWNKSDLIRITQRAMDSLEERVVSNFKSKIMEVA